VLILNKNANMDVITVWSSCQHGRYNCVVVLPTNMDVITVWSS